ncbi:hypothetical protein [Tautonia sociabilis]|uniref:DUF2029 domain-containing protein n=1 Tax=Tautonia sociabilis TaxID=2080755 RepID=A0A432MPU5_9BACT|nr:hypothetical protein [Tautonia sociabilis]RUL89038.1 hypothetical protein TsocGM_04060 [Tautonia sociabilis]
MVPDLGLGPEIWLLLTLLMSVSIFVSFRRPWSLRNLDLLLLFVLAPGIMALVGGEGETTIVPFLWLFVGTGLWLLRCLVDLGLPRRPVLEPNLNAPGLTCLSAGMIALLVAETISLPIRVGEARNPAASDDRPSDAHEAVGAVSRVPGDGTVGPLPVPTRPGVVRWRSTQIILSRVLAGVAHVGVVVGLILLGRGHFKRPIAGLSAAALYLVLPYSRIEVVDSGQLVPAALIVGALLWYERPVRAGLAIGLAAGWMPAGIGLLPLWFGFYRGRQAWGFGGASLSVLGLCVGAGRAFPPLSRWAEAMGARGLAEAGLLPGLEPTTTAGLWSGIDPAYRLPVLIAYLALVLVVSIWPLRKNLGELIALSAAVLLASQFWYLEKGGTMVLLYLPLLLLMMFRPNLSSKRAPRADRSRESETLPALRA